MSHSLTSSRRRLVGLAIVVTSAAIAPAQVPGFHIRMLVVQDEQLDDHREALAIEDGSQAAQFLFDGAANRSTINFGGDGTFDGDEAFPDGTASNNQGYILAARARVTVPPGEWSIAFGSDDGGQLTLPGARFLSTFNEESPSGNFDQIFFDGGRDHAWTGGHISVGALGLDSVDFFASMHQSESGGSFEVAIRDNHDFVDSSVVSAAEGWMLLQDGALLGWSVQTDVVMNEIVGDFNDDGVVDLTDLDLLGEAANNNGAAEFDLDGDGLVDAADRDIFLSGNLITAGNKLNGDADFDGEVQFPDFVVLADNFGQSNRKWSEGDFDISGQVQFPDFVILANNFGKSAVDNVVPEPATRLIALWAGLAALAFRKELFVPESRRSPRHRNTSPESASVGR